MRTIFFLILDWYSVSSRILELDSQKYLKKILCLGIESTAHTFGVGIIDDKGKILANVKDSYTTEQGGIHPTEAKNHHIEKADSVIENALKEAKLELKEIDLISFSQAPGIGHTLRIGAFAARSLALLNNKPIIGINHCIAHLTIGEMLTGAKDPVLLYASGANTQVIAFSEGKYRVFCETLDIGICNCLDKFCRTVGLEFPSGPKVIPN